MVLNPGIRVTWELKENLNSQGLQPQGFCFNSVGWDWTSVFVLFFFFLSIPGDSNMQPRPRTTGFDHHNSPIQVCDSMNCTEFNAISSERGSGLTLLLIHIGERPQVRL